MRIFVAVRHSADLKQFYGSLWSGNFYPALRRLGHELIESQTDLAPASRFMQVADHFTPDQIQIRAGITERIVEEIQRAHSEKPLDLVLSYFYNSHFDPVAFDDIHRLGIPTVNFYCNSIYQFELVAAIAKKARYAWHAEKHARESYLKVGANPVWVQMGGDPEVYYPVLDAVRTSAACFVGQKYADRDRLVAALVRAGVSVDVYGNGWGAKPAVAKTPAVGTDDVIPGSRQAYLHVVRDNIRSSGLFGGLARTLRQWQYRRTSAALNTVIAPTARGFASGIPETFGRYEVCLNFSNVWADGRPGSALIPHVRLRDFEGPMCRVCFLTGYTDEIEEFYKVGEEIDTYRTADELVEKTRYYLSHPDAAERLREAGYQRAIRDHTWDRRFEQLFRAMGLAT